MYLFRIVGKRNKSCGHVFHLGINKLYDEFDDNPEDCGGWVFLESKDLCIFDIPDGRVLVVLSRGGVCKLRKHNAYRVEYPYVEDIISLSNIRIWEIFSETGFPIHSDRWAILMRNIKVFEFLLRNGYKPYKYVWAMTIHNSLYEYIEILINYNIQITENDIIYASSRGNKDILDLITKYVLDQKIKLTNQEIIKYLEKYRRKVF